MTTRIALASFAHVHAASYAELLRDRPDVELLTCDEPLAPYGDGEVRGAELAASLGVDYVSTYEELFAWEPDGVIVCAENSLHRPLTERAAAVGASVLCEKPLATTVADAEAMIRACQDAGVFLMTAYPVRFAPQFQALRNVADAGELGELLAATGTNNGKIPVDARAWFTDPEFSGGGALVDHVVHVADLMDVLLGEQRARRVWATTNQILHRDKPGVPDGVETGGIVTVEYEGGLQLSIDCSWSQPDSAPVWGGLSLEVIGTGGLARIEPFASRLDGFSEKEGATLWVDYGTDLDADLLGAFIQGLRTGVAPQPDGRVGLRTLEIVCAAQESARSGQVVTLT